MITLLSNQIVSHENVLFFTSPDCPTGMELLFEYVKVLIIHLH